jgi:hypothetical protein
MKAVKEETVIPVEDKEEKVVRTPEVQRTRLMELKDFELKKVKFNGKYVDVAHHESGSDAGEVEKKGQTVPHPHLKETLDALAPIMARRLGYLEATDLAIKLIEGKGLLDEMGKLLALEKTIIGRMNVGGIQLNGSGDKFGVIITGSFEVAEGGGTGIAVPKITFNNDTLGYEKETYELVKDVIKEVHAYRFCNKKAQLDLMDEAERIEAEEAAKNTTPKKAKKVDQTEEV